MGFGISVQAAWGPTYLEGPAGSVFVVVADPLQLTAACKLPGDKLEATPQTLTVEEHEELGHHSAEDIGGGAGGLDDTEIIIHFVIITSSMGSDSF